MRILLSIKNHQTIWIKLLFFNVLLTGLADARENLTWEKYSSGLSEQAIKKVIPTDSAIFVLTDKALYQKFPQENTFRQLINFPLSFQEVNDAVIHSEGYIYIATNNGAYKINPIYSSIQEIFQNSQNESKDCQSISIAADNIFVGTQRGIYVQKNFSGPWIALNGGLQRLSIHHLKEVGQYIWAASDQDIYKIEIKNLSIKKVFSIGVNDIPVENDEQDHLNVSNDRDIRAIALAKDLGFVFIATSQGIFRSKDQGKNWSLISTHQLQSQQISALLITNLQTDQNNHMLYQIFVGTDQGVFTTNDGNWERIYQGMEALKVSDLVLIDEEIGAAADQGFYILRKNRLHRLANTQQVEMVKQVEPSIQKVHQMAIHYAEVSPEKIIQWRKLAQKRAWYPDLTIGFDGGEDKTINDSIYGSSSGGGSHYIGPDDKSFGRDFGWDVSLSWDLGDVVWSDVQTSIDNRAKLMVELRDDLLNQVTRLYFERRRMQMELTSEELDEWMFMEKEMRIEELTALIDALTGGEFSREMETRNSKIENGT